MISIVVDHPDAPSQDVDGRPGWKAELDVGDGSGGIEAIAVDGPAAAVALAFRVLAMRKDRPVEVD